MRAILYQNKFLLLPGEHAELGTVATKNGKTITVCEWNYVNWKRAEEKKCFTSLPDPMSLFKYDGQPYKPYSHQKVTSNFLVTHPRSACWNEAGTGKTASVIWAIDYLRQESVIRKVLVICPLSTARSVWLKELFVMMPRVASELLLGSKERRLKALDKGVDIYIVNHDGIKVLEKELNKWAPDLVVIDECTAFKNVRTGRWKAMKSICNANAACWVWLLTGTPMAQSPTDLYGQGRLFCPELVGKSFIRFRDRVMMQTGMYKWAPRQNFENIVREIIQPVIRFSRDECIELPDVLYQSIDVEMSSIQDATFKKLRKDALVEIKGGAITAVNEGVMRNKLLQCCAGWVYAVDEDEQRGSVDLKPTARLEALIDTINESSRGVLVFIPYINAIDNVSKFCEQHKLHCEVITGGVSAKKRSIIFEEFQHGDIKVLIAHPRTMGHGVTLTAADTVVWYLVTSDNELYEQANSRIQRIGQEHKMRVIHLISTTLEKNVLQRLQQKQAMQGVLLDTLKEEQTYD